MTHASLLAKMLKEIEEEQDDGKKKAILEKKADNLRASFVAHADADYKLVKYLDSAARIFLRHTAGPVSRTRTSRNASEALDTANILRD